MVAHGIHRHAKKKKRAKQRSTVDWLVYLAIVIGPVLTMPQVYSIWVQGSKGVSVISWIAYLVASLIWLVYGVKHKDRPIIIVEAIWVVLEVLIVAGIVWR